MNFTVLLQKLIDVERAIGVETESTVRHKVLDAQECLLGMQAEQLRRLQSRTESSEPLPRFESQRLALLRPVARGDISEDES